MNDVPSLSGESVKSSDGFETLAGINDGFLGTGSSSAVELSYIAMVLIIGYVAIGTIKYFRPEFNPWRSIAGVMGLEDR